MQRFTGTLVVGEKGSIGFVELPFDPREVFGKARAPIRGTLNGVPFQSTVAIYGGKHYLGIRRELREAAGVSKTGDRLEIELELDAGERKVTLPPELRRALGKSAAAKAGWASLSFTHQKEWVDALADAKRPETKEKRLREAVAAAEARARKAKARKPASRKTPGPKRSPGARARRR